MKTRLLTGLALVLAASVPLAAQDGGQVVGGEASITNPNASTTQIDQITNRAIINWRDFSIGEGNQVLFNQPTSASVALNRVVGQNPSAILGSLSANGQVFVLNPHGIVFGANSQVNVNGFVASTLALSNEDFMAGNYDLTQDPSVPQSYVINQGTINATSFAALVAPLVENTGTISSPGGTVYLLASSEVVLDITGDGLIGYSIGNVGGGTVNIREDALSDVVRAVVNTDGLVEAGEIVQNADGSVSLVGAGGTLANSGTVTTEGQDGGTIILNSDLASVLTPTSELLSDAGFIEFSTKGNFIFDGLVDTRNASGEFGSFLLDPASILITPSPAFPPGTQDPAIGVPPHDILIAYPDAGPNTLSEQAIAQASVTAGSVILEAGTISFMGIGGYTYFAGPIPPPFPAPAPPGANALAPGSTLTLRTFAAGAGGLISWAPTDTIFHPTGALILDTMAAGDVSIGSAAVGSLSIGTGGLGGPAGTVTLSGTIATGGPVAIVSSGSILDGNGAAPNITGGGVVILGSGTGVGTVGDPLETAIGAVEADGGVGGVHLINDGGSLTVGGIGPVAGIVAGGDISIDVIAGGADLILVEGITTGGGSTVTLGVADAVLDANGGATNITGGALSVTAGSFGTLGDPIETAVAGLEASTAAGDFSVTNTSGLLTIGGVDALTGIDSAGGVLLFNFGDISITEAIDAATSTVVTALSPVTISADITSGSDITVTATDAVGAGDDLTVDPGISVTSTGGSVALQGGDNLIIGAGATVTAATDVTLLANFGAADALGTATLTAGSQAIGGGTGSTVTVGGAFVILGDGTALLPTVLNTGTGGVSITSTTDTVSLGDFSIEVGDGPLAITAAGGAGADIFATSVGGSPEITANGDVTFTAGGGIGDIGQIQITGDGSSDSTLTVAKDAVGGDIDLVVLTDQFNHLDISLVDANSDVGLVLTGGDVIDVTGSGGANEINNIVLTGTSLSYVLTDPLADLLIHQTTIVAGGDLYLASALDILLGDGINPRDVAIDASGGAFDVSLEADVDSNGSGAIVDQSGDILMAGGSLQLLSGSGVGTVAAPIITRGATDIGGATSTTGGFFVTNDTVASDLLVTTTAGLLTNGGVPFGPPASTGITAPGQVTLTNLLGDITASEVVTGSGVLFDADVVASGDSVTVNNGAVITATDGDIDFLADGTVTVTAASTVDANDAGSGLGGVTMVGPQGVTIDGGTAVFAASDIDIDSSAGTVSIQGPGTTLDTATDAAGGSILVDGFTGIDIDASVIGADLNVDMASLTGPVSISTASAVAAGTGFIDIDSIASFVTVAGGSSVTTFDGPIDITGETGVSILGASSVTSDGGDIDIDALNGTVTVLTSTIDAFAGGPGAESVLIDGTTGVLIDSFSTIEADLNVHIASATGDVVVDATPPSASTITSGLGGAPSFTEILAPLGDVLIGNPGGAPTFISSAAGLVNIDAGANTLVGNSTVTAVDAFILGAPFGVRIDGDASVFVVDSTIASNDHDVIVTSAPGAVTISASDIDAGAVPFPFGPGSVFVSGDAGVLIDGAGVSGTTTIDANNGAVLIDSLAGPTAIVDSTINALDAFFIGLPGLGDISVTSATGTSVDDSDLLADHNIFVGSTADVDVDRNGGSSSVIIGGFGVFFTGVPATVELDSAAGNVNIGAPFGATVINNLDGDVLVDAALSVDVDFATITSGDVSGANPAYDVRIEGDDSVSIADSTIAAEENVEIVEVTAAGAAGGVTISSSDIDASVNNATPGTVLVTADGPILIDDQGLTGAISDLDANEGDINIDSLASTVTLDQVDLLATDNNGLSAGPFNVRIEGDLLVTLDGVDATAHENVTINSVSGGVTIADTFLDSAIFNFGALPGSISVTAVGAIDISTGSVFIAHEGAITIDSSAGTVGIADTTLDAHADAVIGGPFDIFIQGFDAVSLDTVDVDATEDVTVDSESSTVTITSTDILSGSENGDTLEGNTTITAVGDITIDDASGPSTFITAQNGFVDIDSASGAVSISDTFIVALDNSGVGSTFDVSIEGAGLVTLSDSDVAGDEDVTVNSVAGGVTISDSQIDAADDNGTDYEGNVDITALGAITITGLGAGTDITAHDGSVTIDSDTSTVTIDTATIDAHEDFGNGSLFDVFIQGDGLVTLVDTTVTADENVDVDSVSGGVTIRSSDIDSASSLAFAGDVTITAFGAIQIDDSGTLGVMEISANDGEVFISGGDTVMIVDALVEAVDAFGSGAPFGDISVLGVNTVSIDDSDLLADRNVTIDSAAADVEIDRNGGSSTSIVGGLFTGDLANAVSITAAGNINIGTPGGTTDITNLEQGVTISAGLSADITDTTINSLDGSSFGVNGAFVLIEAVDQVTIVDSSVQADEDVVIQELGGGLSNGVTIISTDIDSGLDFAFASITDVDIFAVGDIVINDANGLGSEIDAFDGSVTVDSSAGSVTILDTFVSALDPFGGTGFISVLGQTGVTIDASDLLADSDLLVQADTGDVLIDTAATAGSTLAAGLVNPANVDILALDGSITIGSTLGYGASTFISTPDGDVTIDADAGITPGSGLTTIIDADVFAGDLGSGGNILVDGDSGVTSTQSNYLADFDIDFFSADGDISITGATGVVAVDAFDDLRIRAGDSITLAEDFFFGDESVLWADLNADGIGGIAQTAEFFNGPRLLVISTESVLLGDDVHNPGVGGVLTIDELELVALDPTGGLAPMTANITVTDPASFGFSGPALDLVDFGPGFADIAVEPPGTSGFSIETTTSATGRDTEVHVHVVGTLNENLNVLAEIDPTDLHLTAVGDINLFADVTVTDTFQAEADTDIDGVGGIEQDVAATVTTGSFIGIASEHSAIPTVGILMGLGLESFFADFIELHIRPAAPTPTDIIVFDAAAVTALDLGDPAGFGDVGDATFSIDNPVGSVLLESSNLAGTGSITIGDGVTPFLSQVFVEENLTLAGDDGVTINDSIFANQSGAVEFTLIDGDFDFDGIGGVVQVDVSNTYVPDVDPLNLPPLTPENDLETIEADELSVAAGSGGISLGQNGTQLLVDSAEFEITGLSAPGTNILVNNGQALILEDLGLVAGPNSVFNPVGSVDIRTIDPSRNMVGVAPAASTLTVDDPILAAANVRLSTVDVGNADILVNASILSDLGADGFASTVDIFAGDDILIAIGADIEAEFRIDLRAGENQMAAMPLPGPFPSDSDNLGAIIQAGDPSDAGTIRTTDVSPGSGDIVLRSLTGTSVQRLVARRLQASNSTAGDIVIRAQSDLELADIDGLGFSLVNAAGAFPTGPFNNISLILTNDAVPDLLDPWSLVVTDDVFTTGSVVFQDGNEATAGPFILVDACIQAIAGTITLNGASYPGPVSGDNSVFFTSNACFISYGPASYVLIVCDNDPSTNLDLLIENDITVPGRIVLIAEGSIVVNGAELTSLIGIVAIADWQFCDPDNVGGIYTTNGGVFRADDFQFQAGGYDANLEANVNAGLAFDDPDVTTQGGPVNGPVTIAAGRTIDVTTEASNPATVSAFQVEVRETALGGPFIVAPALSSDVFISHAGDAEIVSGGIVFPGETFGMANPIGSIVFDVNEHPSGGGDRDLLVSADVLTSRDILFSAAGDIIVDDVNLFTDVTGIFDLAAPTQTIRLEADSDGDNLGLVDQNVNFAVATPSGISTDDLVVIASEGITLPNTFVSRAQLINLDGSGDIFMHNTGDLELIDLDPISTNAVDNNVGNVFIEAASDITVTSPVSALGDITLRAIGAPGSDIFLNESVTSTGGGTLDLFARANIVDDGDQTTVLATTGQVILQAELGAIGHPTLTDLTNYVDVTLGNTALISATAAGNVLVQEVGAATDISTSQIIDFSSTTGGQILGLSTDDGNIVVDAEFGTGADTVILTASNDISGNGLITAPALVLDAAGGIDLTQTQVSALEILADDDVNVVNIGDLSLEVIRTGTVFAVDIAGGSLTLSTTGNLTITDADVFVDDGNVSLSSGGTLALTGSSSVTAVNVSGGLGNVRLESNGSMSLSGTPLVVADGHLDLVSAADFSADNFVAIADFDLDNLGNFTLTVAGNATLIGDVSGENISIASQGTLTADAALTAANGVQIEGLAGVSLSGNNGTIEAGGSVQIDSDGNILIAQAIGLGVPVADVSIDALGSVVIDESIDSLGPVDVFASGDVELGSLITAGNVTITSTIGSIVDLNGGALNIAAGAASLSAATGIGSASDALDISVPDLTTQGGGDQYLNVPAGLAALDLNTSGGIVLTAGAPITDADPSADITATWAEVTAPAFGDLTGAINTVLDSLTVDTSAANGDQFIAELDALLALHLDAGTGSVTLSAGDITDADATADILAALADLTATSIGTSSNPIGTSVDSLATDTSAAGGDQFLSETDNVIVDDLNAGAGDISLSAGGTIADGGLGTSITAASLSLTAGSGIVGPLLVEVDTLAATVTGPGSIDLVDLTGTLHVTSASTVAGDITLIASAGDMTADSVTAGGLGGVALLVGPGAGSLFLGEVVAVDDIVILSAPSGVIVDNNGADTNVTAGLLDLSAGFGIGTSGDPIETSVNDLVGADGGLGGIFLSDSSSLRILGIGATAAGDISISAAGTLDVSAPVVGGPIVTLTAGTDVDLFSDVIGLQVHVTAGRNIRQFAGTVDGAGVVVFDAGRMVALGDVRSQGGLPTGQVVVIAQTGSIINQSGGVNITANAATLIAAGGIGTATTPILTDITQLEASAGSGGIYLDNAGAGLTTAVTTAVWGTLNGVSSAGGDIVLGTTGNLLLDEAVNAGSGNVSLSATGAILDGNPTGIDIVAGTIVLSAITGIGPVDALETAGDRLTVTNVTSGDVNVSDAGDLIVDGASNTGGALDITVSGSLTVAGDVTVSGTLDLVATGGSLTVQDSNVTSTGGEVFLGATGDIFLLLDPATIDADSNLLIDAGGNLLISGDDAAGTSELTAGNQVDLVAGGDVTIDGAILFGNIALDISATGNLTQTASGLSTNGTLSLSAGGTVSISGDGIAGVDELFADGGISLSGTAGVSLTDMDAINDSGPVVITSGADVTITDSFLIADTDALSVVAGGDLTVWNSDLVSTNADLTLSAGGVLAVRGTSSFLFASDNFGPQGDVLVSGATAVLLEGALLVADDGNVSVTSAGNVTTDAATNVFATDNVLISAGGSLSITGDGLPGTPEVQALGDVNLDGAVDLVLVDAEVDGASISLRAGNNAALNGDTTVTSTGSIDLDVAGDLAVADDAEINAGLNLTATVGGSVLLSSNGRLTAGNTAALAVSGNLTLTGNGTIDPADDLTIAVGGNALLANDSVVSTGGTLDLDVVGDLSLVDSAQIDASGSATLTVGGNVLLTNDSSINPSGSVNLDVTGNLSLADDASISPSGSVTATVGGDALLTGNAAIDPSGSVSLDITGSLAVADDASISPSGSVTATVGGDALLTGNATIDPSGSVSLDVVGHLSLVDSASLSPSGSVTATVGGDVLLSGSAQVDPSGSVTLDISGNLTLANDSTVGPGGSATISVGGNVLVDGTSNIDPSGNLSLDAAGDISIPTGNIDASGTIDLSAGGDVLLGDGVSIHPSNLNVLAGGSITVGNVHIHPSGSIVFDATGGITVGNGAFVNSTGSNVEFTAGGNLIVSDFSDVSADDDVELTAAGNISILDSEVYSDDDNVSIIAGGNLTVEGSGINVSSGFSNNLLLAATGDIFVVGSDLEAGFGDLLVDAGGNVTLEFSTAIAADSDGAVDVIAGGNLVVHESGIFSTDENVTLTAGGTLTIRGLASLVNALVLFGPGGDVILNAGQGITIDEGALFADDGNIEVTAGDNLDLVGADLDAFGNRITLIAGGWIQAVAGGSIVADQLILCATSGIWVPNADVNTLQAMNTASGTLTVYNVGDVDLVDLLGTGFAVFNAGGDIVIETGTGPGPLSGVTVSDPIEATGNVTIDSDDSIIVDADITSGDTIILLADEAIDQTGGLIQGNDLILEADDFINLPSTHVNRLQAMNTGSGDIFVQNSGTLIVTDILSAGHGVQNNNGDEDNDTVIEVIDGDLFAELVVGYDDIELITSNSGNVHVGSVTSVDDDIDVISAGDILELGDDTTSDLTAFDRIDLIAAGGIGTELNPIEIDAQGGTGSDSDFTANGGDLNLVDVDGGLVVDDVFTTGTARITALNGSLSIADIDALALEAVSVGGSIMVTDQAGNLRVDADATFDIMIDIQTGALLLGLIDAGGMADLRAGSGLASGNLAGSILDDNDVIPGVLNVRTGGDAHFNASGVVGTLANCIEVQIGGNAFATAGGSINGISIALCGTVGGGNPIVIIPGPGGGATFNGLEFLPELIRARASINPLIDPRRTFDPILHFPLLDSHIDPQVIEDDRERPEEPQPGDEQSSDPSATRKSALDRLKELNRSLDEEKPGDQR